jgi:dihydrofolate reductase/thymidylate synthase
MDYSIVIASDKNLGIGKNNSIPWNIAEDMKYFRDITKHETKINVVIMGRKTADTLKSTLSSRVNIVITNKVGYRKEEGFESYTNIEDCFMELKQSRNIIGEIFVIGGSTLIETFISHKLYSRYLRKIYFNQIDEDYDCDIILPNNFIKLIDSHKSYHKTILKKNIVKCKNTQKDITITYNIFNYYNSEENQYLNIGLDIIINGDHRKTRNAETYSLFGKSIVFDLKNGFPLLTTKKMFCRGIFEELLFFLRGETNTQLLADKKIRIWNGNTSKKFIEDNQKNLQEYDMGPMYGFQFRHFNAQYDGMDKDYTNQGIDQFKNVVQLLIDNPHSRRILMTSYNPEQAEEGVLYPCHGLMIQFYVQNNCISLQMYQRSADWGLGVPFNIASYGALLHIVVNMVNNMGNKNYDLGKVIMVFGDYHIYENHMVELNKQFKRKAYPFPDFTINKKIDSFEKLHELEFSDMVVSNYISHGKVKMEMTA